MFRGHSDVPLERDASTLYLPWIIALMVWLAILALAAATTVSQTIARWDTDLAGTLTVQIMPPNGDRDAVEMARRVNQALDILETHPGVLSATPLDLQDVSELLGPWLGGTDLPDALPLPQLIDVLVDADTAPDPATLEAILAAEVPGIVVDDHRAWLGDLITFARAVEVLAMLVVVLVALAGVAIVTFATRSGFAIHRHVVEVLHMIGAQDAYIAAQFQAHALRLGVKGGLIGLGLSAVALLVIAYLGNQIQSTLLPAPSFGWAHLAILLLVPTAAVGLVMLTARAVVIRGLARMV